jgi:outer membrane protein
MKKTAVIVMTILILSVYLFSEVKIGVINPQKLVEETKKGKEIARRFENLRQQKENAFTTMQDEIKKLEKELASPALSMTARESKSLELDQKKTAIKRFAEDSRKELQTRLDREVNALKGEIHPVLRQYGKEKGYTIIFEMPAAVYFDPVIDITDEIIKILDSK